MRIAPLQALTAASVVLLLTVLLVVYLALRTPVLGIQFAPLAEEPALQVVSVANDSPNRDSVSPGTVIVSLADTSGTPIRLDAALLIEEPDQLEQWSVYNDFIARQGRIASALASGTVRATRGQGGVLTLHTRARLVSDLPEMFWLQILFGATGFLVAAGVWAFRQGDRAAWFFLLAGLCFLIFSSAASVYSTRELAMDGSLVLALSRANHFGALFFTASLLALLWHYPRRLGRLPLDWLGYGVATASWLSIVTQTAPDITFSYTATLLLFAPTFLLAFLQWRGTRGRPVERAALKWYLLSIYIGTGLFAAFILIPSALSIAPPASQGLMFMVFLFMFVGIALGITRYRLFDLDRWWFGAWSWFLGGVVVIALDLLLVTVSGLPQAGAFTLSLALVGWLYFPLRQWLWSRLHHDNPETPRSRLENWVQALFSATSERRLEQVWAEVLAQEYQPLELLQEVSEPREVMLEDHGQRLRLPSLVSPEASLLISYPGHGNRLFNRQDRVNAELLLRMGRRALGVLREREHSVMEERHRIMRDLHDDVGAKLLSLVYMAGGGESEQLARSAVQDMREVLAALEAEPCNLADALAAWHGEALTRAENLGFTLEWSADGVEPEAATALLSARERTNIGRILREGITNALKHAGGRQVVVSVEYRGGTLHIRLSDDGVDSLDPAQWSLGRGTRTVRTRIEDLGGAVHWHKAQGQGCRMDVVVPLEHADGAPITPG